MTTESNEQYRAGFEAWAIGEWPNASFVGAKCSEGWYYFDDALNESWRAWIASKREASTEPSAIPDVLFDGNAVFAEITRLLGKSHCISPVAMATTLDAVVSLMRKAGSAGALTDDAKDAARYRTMRRALSRKELDYYALEGESEEEIDAWIDAHTEAGSGK